MIKLVISAMLLLLVPFCYGVTFTTENSEKMELATVELLQALRKSHDITQWEFTDIVHIKKKTIPHSHPVLTLHTRHTINEQKDLLLSTYLHEQIHWHLDNNLKQTDAAILELKSVFKNVPVGFPKGARDEYSTYLHLLVCFLEIEVVSELLSQQRVQAISQFWQQDHYTWVYQQVEKNKHLLEKIVNKHGLNI